MPVISTENKIKIAFVVWTLEGMGGSERVVFDIVRKLNKNRYEIFVLSFKDGPVRNLYENLGAKVRVFIKRRKIDLNFIKDIRNYLVEKDIDILNPHHLSPFYCSFLAARRTSAKILFTEHSQWQLEELGLAWKILNKILFRKVDGFVAISEQIKRFYLSELKLRQDRIHLITNGIDLYRFRKMDHNGKKWELGFESNDKIIGMVANIRPEKNHKLLLSAFNEIAKEMKDTHLLLVGFDCMDGRVQEISRKFEVADRIHFLGMREDVPEILNILDIFCLTSFHEGLPISVLEAMACEVPVVGADVLGINEVIKDKENGLLFPLKDERTLINYLRSLLINDDLRRAMGRRGRIYVEANYNLERKMEDYDALFENLLHHGSGGRQTVAEFSIRSGSSASRK